MYNRYRIYLFTTNQVALETVWRNRYRLGPPWSPNVGIPLPRGGLMYSRASVRANLNVRALLSSKVGTEKVCGPELDGCCLKIVSAIGSSE